MPRLSSLETLERLYATRGRLSYGEDLSQIEHALQCAALAEEADAPPSLVVAALLHDVGHLFASEDVAMGLGVDGRHEIVGAQALKGLFGDAVCAPIALHVAAKRYLCIKEANYFRDLSPASRRSLDLQGGPFDVAQAAAFERRPHWRDAVALRRFDDMGKRQEPTGRAFADFAAPMRTLLIGGSKP